MTRSAPTSVATTTPKSDLTATSWTVHARTRVGALDLVVASSSFSPIVYELDCVAGLTHCSREAYEARWLQDFGSISEADRAQLQPWAALQLDYRVTFESQSEHADPKGALQLPRMRRSLDATVRLAGLTASSTADYTDRLRLFMRPDEVAEASAIVSYFAPHFGATDPQPQARAFGLEFVNILQTSHLDAWLPTVANFYGFVSTVGTELVFLPIDRPVHDSPNHGELVAGISLIEIVRGEPVAHRIDVVLPELFHYFHASSSHSQQVTLVDRFAQSHDPLATVAYSYLNEVLATTLGNGIVDRTLNPTDFAKRILRPNGLFSDSGIDAISKQLLGPLEALLAENRSITSPDFFNVYMAAVHRAFPNGLPLRAYLKMWACLYDSELKAAYTALDDVAGSSSFLISNNTSVPKEVSPIFSAHADRTHVLIVTRKGLTRSRNALPKPLFDKVVKRAKLAGPFIFADQMQSERPTFVFVADTEDEMLKLVKNFADLAASSDGELHSP